MFLFLISTILMTETFRLELTAVFVDLENVRRGDKVVRGKDSVVINPQ